MEKNIDAFNRDVQNNEGYLYSTNAKLSSVIANKRYSDVIRLLLQAKGKKVIDIGCGDGTYTVELLSENPASIVGIDPAGEGIAAARKKTESSIVKFEVCGAYELPFPDDSFDVAHIRGVLHHLDRPSDAIKEALRVADTIVVLEPNGYNPILKVLERVSTYHRAHDEQSFTSSLLCKWVREAGGTVEKDAWCGLVPFFCPDWLARCLKAVEPLVEALPVVRCLACGVYSFRARKVRHS